MVIWIELFYVLANNGTLFGLASTVWREGGGGGQIRIPEIECPAL